MAEDFTGAFVISGLDAGMVGDGIHDVGFHEDDGAVVESVGEEVSGPEVGVFSNRERVGVVGRIDEGGEAAGFGEDFGDGGSEFGFFVVGALEEFFEHGEALVGEGDFLVVVGTVEEEMEVGAVDEGWLVGVAPAFGVEVEAEDEVWLEGEVDEVGAGADFGGAVEESFGEFLEGGWGVVAGGRGGLVDEGLGAEQGDGFWFFADEGDAGAEGFELGAEEFGDEECHVAFGDGGLAIYAEPAFFHFRPFTADVTGVDGDVESIEGFSFRRRWQVGGGFPLARGGGGEPGWGEVEGEDVCGWWFSGLDAGGGFGDFDEVAPGISGGENGGEECAEVVAGDGVLIEVEARPFGWAGEG